MPTIEDGPAQTGSIVSNALWYDPRRSRSRSSGRTTPPDTPDRHRLPMRRFALVLVFLLLVGAAAGATWWFHLRQPPTNELALYGNVDLRQVELPFNDSERIAAVLVQEGDCVRKGQVLARLDTRRLEPQVAQQ